jgi:hypothetical protein
MGTDGNVSIYFRGLCVLEHMTWVVLGFTCL